ncbi:MAG: OmpA family protein [Alphaproteobacteria bacterium]|nr:OmpA family protein [Alphaproteobacteria bacterium]
MKKRIAAIAALACLLSSVPAWAQYHDYKSTQPSVEVDLGVLDALPGDNDGYQNTYQPSYAPDNGNFPAPITSRRLPDNYPLSAVRAEPLAQPASTVPRKLLKPVFTAQPKSTTAKTLIPAEKPHRAVPVQPAPAYTEPKHVAPRTTPPAPQVAAKPKTPPPAVPSKKDLVLTFTDNSSEIDAILQDKLDAIVAQMKDLTDTRLQVRAYATGEDGNKSSARRISLSRALSVRAYLMDNGIKPNRVDVRALGTETDQSPLDRVDLVFVR